MPEMYLLPLLKPLTTYPFDVSWLSMGSALTAAHFCQTATKVSKKALPYHTAASAVFDFDLPALPGGREEVLWSGSTGMDAGRAAMGQGWPVAAGPRSRAGVREPERSEGRTMGRKRFGYFAAFAK